MATVEQQTWKPTNSEYHASPEVGHSMLKVFRKSRQDYYATYEAKTKSRPEPSDEMNLGTAFHYAILEPDLLHQRVAFAPECDRRTKDGKALRGSFQAESIGKTVLPWAFRERLDGMICAIKRNAAAMSIIENCKDREVSIRWEDGETGLQLKSRLDSPIHGDQMIVADLKTCREVAPGGFARAMAALGYHTQAGFYSEGCRVVYGCEPRFVFIAVANCEPYSCAVYEIHQDAIDRGRRLNRRALFALKECYETDDWREPHEKQITKLGLPRYESFEDEWEIT